MSRQLKARVRSVHPDQLVPLSRDRQLLSPKIPLWEWGSSNGKEQNRPGAFELGAGPAVLSLQIEAQGADASTEYELRGTHGRELLFAGRVKGGELGQAPLQVKVTAQVEPRRFFAFKDDIRWELRGAGDAVDAGRTPLELYWVPAEALLPFTRGISVEFLQDLAQALAVSGLHHLLSAVDPDPGADIESVAWWCFLRNPPRYDSEQGMYHFIGFSAPFYFDKISLYLSKYLVAKGETLAVCNCYDQTAVLQLYLRTLHGKDVQFCFIKPFGYLARSYLIGRGPSNNPFYLHDNTEPLIDETDPRRSCFYNHAFCQLTKEGHVADSCAGPHCGDQTVDDYLAQATDGTTPPDAKVSRGTPEGITYYQGVTQVDVLSSVPSTANVLETDESRSFKAAVSFEDQAMPDDTQGVGVACAWPDLREAPGMSSVAWELSYEEVLPGPQDARKYWHFHDGISELSLTLYVASDNSGTARQRFVTLGSVHQMPRPTFSRGPKALGHSAAMYMSAQRQRYLWVFHTVVFDLLMENPRGNIDLEAVALWLQRQAEAAVVPDLSAYLPPIRVTPQTGIARVGGTVTLHVSARADALLQPLYDTASLRLVDEFGGALTFLVNRSGVHEVGVVAVDPRTLLLSSETVRVPTRGAPRGP